MRSATDGSSCGRRYRKLLLLPRGRRLRGSRPPNALTRSSSRPASAQTSARCCPRREACWNATGAPLVSGRATAESGAFSFAVPFASALGQLRQIGVEAQGIADAGHLRERRGPPKRPVPSPDEATGVLPRRRGRHGSHPNEIGLLRLQPMPSRPKFTGFCRTIQLRPRPRAFRCLNRIPLTPATGRISASQVAPLSDWSIPRPPDPAGSTRSPCLWGKKLSCFEAVRGYLPTRR